MVLDKNLIQEHESVILSNRDIFTQIWFSPRKVIRYINNTRYDRLVYFLLFMAGMTSAFNRASSQNMGDEMSLGAIIAICVLVGGAFGWISYWIISALLSWTGKWIGGKGNREGLLRMIAHAMIPSIAALVLLIIQISNFGNEIFQSTMDITSYGITGKLVFYISLVIEIVLGLWTTVIYVVGISEVHGFSVGKAILNLILSIGVILIPIMIIVILFQSFL